MDQYNVDANTTSQTQATPGSSVAPVPPQPTEPSTFDKIRRITAWTMIVSAISFALIGVLAVWQVFGNETGDIVWRAFSSLAIIAFAALIVNVASRMVENNR